MASHSHRPTTKVSHKAFKSRKTTKGQLRDRAKGRVDGESGARKTPHQNVMSKIERRNQAKQRQLAKRKDHLDETRVFSGRDGAPRIVAVIPLCSDSDPIHAVRRLNDSVDIDTDLPGSQKPSFRVGVERFKQKLQYVPVPRDVAACMDAARVADFVLVLLSGVVQVDQLGEVILRSVESQGLSTMFTAVHGLDAIEPAKQRGQVVSSLKSYITHFHPDQDKIFNLDNRQECSNLMRGLCSATPRGINWRDQRSYMLVDAVRSEEGNSDMTIFTGVIRGRALQVDRPVQVGDWGTFQIAKITAAPLGDRVASSETDQGFDEVLLASPSNDRDDLGELAPGDVEMVGHDPDVGQDAGPAGKGVPLDDHCYFSDEDAKGQGTKVRVPRGTSSYQSAWYLGDDQSDDGSDYEDLVMEEDGDVEAEPGGGGDDDGDMKTGPIETAASDYAQSEMLLEPDEAEDARQLAEYRSGRRDEVEDDKEFPDEMELQPDVLARQRLHRYRGLMSFRESVWQHSDDRAHEPTDWRRLLQVPNYTASCARRFRETLTDGIRVGTRVNVHVMGAPQSSLLACQGKKPITLFSLLRHEVKKTVVNFLINLSSDYPKSLKSKEELIVQCGPRRFVINPLFSQLGVTPNDVHKYCRWLHPGQSAVATFVGPLTWGSVPLLFFKRASGHRDPAEGTEDPNAGLGLSLVGVGTSLPPSTSRVIAKRAILTGHPYHIHKKVVTIRYMFFNKEDVDWFKALPLWTKRGRRGEVKETLGTHGYFKATFDGRINPQDSVAVSLYKRVWPRNAAPLNLSLIESLEGAQVGATGDAEMDVD